MTGFLSGLLASVLRPIIREEMEKLKSFLVTQWQRKEAFEKYDIEAKELIDAAESATTTEEVWVHLRKLKEARAKLK